MGGTLAAVGTTAARTACDDIVDVAWLADSEVADSLVDVEAGAADSLVAAGAADSLVLCDVDSLVLCDVDSEVDSLAASPLPGARTALPSVARVLRFAAVTS